MFIFCQPARISDTHPAATQCELFAEKKKKISKNFKQIVTSAIKRFREGSNSADPYAPELIAVFEDLVAYTAEAKVATTKAYREELERYLATMKERNGLLGDNNESRAPSRVSRVELLHSG